MRKKTKNKILKGITATSVILLLFGACCLDGDHFVVQVIIMGLSLLWIFVFSLANGE